MAICKRMRLIIINIMLIAELEKCGKELLINSQSKVITRNFHGFFFLDKKTSM